MCRYSTSHADISGIVVDKFWCVRSTRLARSLGRVCATRADEKVTILLFSAAGE